MLCFYGLSKPSWPQQGTKLKTHTYQTTKQTTNPVIDNLYLKDLTAPDWGKDILYAQTINVEDLM